jgi:hypothetical protein
VQLSRYQEGSKIEARFRLEVTLQYLNLETLISSCTGLAAVVGGMKFSAMAGEETARYLARPRAASAIAPGD